MNPLPIISDQELMDRIQAVIDRPPESVREFWRKLLASPPSTPEGAATKPAEEAKP